MQTNDLRPCRKCNIDKPYDKFNKHSSVCFDCLVFPADIICAQCNKNKPAKDFPPPSRGISIRKICKQCRTQNAREERVATKQDPEAYKKLLAKNAKSGKKSADKRNERFETEDIDSCINQFLQVSCRQARSRATIAQLDFDIDTDYLLHLYDIQSGKCALTGIKFDLKRTKKKGKDNKERIFAPSLDRIDSTKGYTKDNVRLLCLMVNIALNTFGDELFDKMCVAYINNKNK